MSKACGARDFSVSGFGVSGFGTLGFGSWGCWLWGLERWVQTSGLRRGASSCNFGCLLDLATGSVLRSVHDVAQTTATHLTHLDKV